jgi:hypothetical protein
MPKFYNFRLITDNRKDNTEKWEQIKCNIHLPFDNLMLGLWVFIQILSLLRKKGSILDLKDDKFNDI